jgi:hypothetical protein
MVRPGFPWAERKLLDGAPPMQIGRASGSPAESRTCQSGGMGSPPPLAADALFGLLMPLWQLVIGVLVLVTVVVSIHRLFLRGPSRMGGAMLLVGGVVLCIAVMSFLVQQI